MSNSRSHRKGNVLFLLVFLLLISTVSIILGSTEAFTESLLDNSANHQIISNRPVSSKKNGLVKNADESSNRSNSDFALARYLSEVGTFTVSNLNDNGAGSLRQAIIDANTTPGAEIINFQDGLTGTITLTSGELGINSDLTINGNSTNLITVNAIANGNFRVINVGQNVNVTINNLIISGGYLTLDMPGALGGGIYNAGTLSMNNCRIANNNLLSWASQGGGIYNTGILYLTNCTVSDNNAYSPATGISGSTGFGGGIANTGSVRLVNTVITNNKTRGNLGFTTAGTARGGGIYNSGATASAEIIDCTISGNSSNATFTTGGGIYNNGELNIAKSSISSNTSIGSGASSSTSGGGGIYNAGGSLNISNSTIGYNNISASNFSTSNQSGGGGIYAAGTVTFRNVTVSGNSGRNPFANDIGGVKGGFSLKNTIIANNTFQVASNPQIASDLNGGTSEGFNLIGSVSNTAGWQASDLLNRDPLLAPLDNYGGPTSTFALLPSSPAINTGNNSNVSATDQRGVERIFGGTVDIGAYESNCSYSINPTNQSFSSAGGTGTVNVSVTGTGCAWTAQSDVNWVSPTSGQNGNGNGIASFNVQENTGIARTGNLTIAGQTFTVTQASGCSYTLTPTSTDVPAGGGNGNFNISSGTGCQWASASNNNWISITSGNSGTGNGTVAFSLQPNTGPARTGTITAGGQTFTVNQAGGCSYSLSATSTNFNSSGGNGSVNVSAGGGCPWTAVSNANWITVTLGSNGNGNGTVAFSVEANNGLARTGTITIADQTFTITQTSGCAFTISPTNTTFTASGGSGSFNLTASNQACSWTAATAENWITINGATSGIGNATISFTVQANVTPSRTGSIIAGGQTFTINQSSGCAFTLSSNSASYPNSGGSGNFNVNSGAGCTWTAVTDVSWITIISGGSGTGTGAVAYSVAANTGPARAGTITAGNQTFTISQANGCTYSLSATSISVPPAGGNASVNVTSAAGCAWTTVSNVSWITVLAGSSGSGNGTVTLTVEPNTGVDRSGTVTIASQTFTVNQGLGCSYSLSPSNTNINASGGIGSFNVTSGNGCSWTAMTANSWIIINNGSSGSGNGSVNFTVQSNIGPNRTGTITVNGQSFTINQASGCTFQLSSSSASFPPTGGSGSFNINTAAGCQWTAVSNVPWIIITSGSSGNTSGTISYMVNPNPGLARAGTITAGGQTFTINQAIGCIININPTSQNVNASGIIAFFNLTASDAGCSWNAVSNHPWITLNGTTSGTGNAMISYTVTANTGPARTGWISVADRVFFVNQAAPVVTSRQGFDYDGDGKADLSVFRPSTGSWYLSRSSDNAFVGVQFGTAGDLIAPGDFDGDGKTDICVFRPSDGGWYRINSSNNTFTPAQFGTNGDLPVPGDFDGDGKADLSVYRPSAGSWYRINSSTGQFAAAQFGIAEDKPLVGDFDGDGKSDLAVFRPSNGTWYRINSATDTFSPAQFGTTGDLPVAADYDGDGKTDLAVYRPSVGDWYIINSSNSSFTGIHFGVTEDRPAPADFDGDRKTDLVVFRPSSGTWYLLRTTAGFTGFQFGAPGDIPTPGAFVR